MITEAKIKQAEGLVRDLRTGAILTSDPKEYDSFRIRKARKLVEQRREREFQSLKNEVEDLKAMVAELLHNLSK